MTDSLSDSVKEALVVGLAARDAALREDANDQIGAFNAGALAFHRAVVETTESGDGVA